MAKQSKPTRAEKDLTHVLIQTQAGQSIISKNSYVWVKAGEKTAAKKLVEDLKPGDQVLETNSRVSVTLNELKNALKERDADYQKAHALLHIQDEKTGEYKPRLQHYLQTALAARNLDLTDKEDKQKAIELIKERLQTVNKFTDNWFGDEKPAGFKGRSITTDAAIEKWLTGKTVAPSNPLHLRALRRFNPKLFTEIFGNGDKITASTISQTAAPIIWASKTINKAHSDIRVWREGRNVTREDQDVDLTDSNEDDGKKSNSPAIKTKRGKDAVLLAQRKIIHDTLIKPIYDKIDTQHGFVLVKNVREIPAATAKTTKTTGTPITPSLHRGVMHADKAQLPTGVETTDYARLTGEYWALKSTLAKIMSIKLLRPESPGVKGEVHLGLLVHAHHQTKGNAFTLHGIPESNVRIQTPLVQNWLNKGEFDKLNRLPGSTTRKLLTRYLQLIETHPAGFEMERTYSELYNLFRAVKQGTPYANMSGLNNAIEKLVSYGVPLIPYSSALASYPEQTPDNVAKLFTRHIKSLAQKGLRVPENHPIIVPYVEDQLKHDLTKHAKLDPAAADKVVKLNKSANRTKTAIEL